MTGATAFPFAAEWPSWLLAVLLSPLVVLALIAARGTWRTGDVRLAPRWPGSPRGRRALARTLPVVAVLTVPVDALALLGDLTDGPLAAVLGVASVMVFLLALGLALTTFVAARPRLVLPPARRGDRPFFRDGGRTGAEAPDDR